MSGYEVMGLVAQAAEGGQDGDAVLGFLVLAGIVWLLWAIFGGKKDKYLVTRTTSVRKLD